MNLQELLGTDFQRQNILIIGKSGSGKTYLSNLLEPMLKHHEFLHCDTYLKLYEDVGRQIYAIYEDAACYQPNVVEGVLGYTLLLEGFKRQSYLPDIVIEVSIPAGKQREIYLAERDPDKLKYLRRFERFNQHSLNEYFRTCPSDKQAKFITLNNEY